MSNIDTHIRNRYAIRRYGMTGVKLDESRLEKEGIAVVPIDTSLPRPDWADYFFAIAVQVSQRASCPRAKCGTVLVNPITHQILSTGYNGSPPGEPHCIDEGCIMEDDHCQRAIHSEVNAVAHAARSGISVDGSIAYVVSTKHTESCRECKKVLKSANIACTIVRKII